MSKVVRVAVIGYGGMGGWHTKRLQEIPGVVELAGVYDILPERNAAAEANGIKAYPSLEALLADDTVDAVTVAIPNDQHKPVCIQAMEAGKLVISEKPVTLCTADLEEMIAAALLHDVVEDAGVTGEELEARFGNRVKELVLAESEDKSKSWEQRKAFTLSHLADSSRDVKILALGDKLSNMRSTARDYMVIGDAVWERFNVKEKKMHAWYYCGIADALEELSTHFYYDEYVLLCRKVFGKH